MCQHWEDLHYSVTQIFQMVTSHVGKGPQYKTETDLMERNNLVPGSTWQVTFKKMPLVVSDSSVHSCAKTLLNVPPSSKHVAVWSWLSAACHADWMWTQPGHQLPSCHEEAPLPSLAFFGGLGVG